MAFHPTGLMLRTGIPNAPGQAQLDLSKLFSDPWKDNEIHKPLKIHRGDIPNIVQLAWGHLLLKMTSEERLFYLPDDQLFANQVQIEASIVLEYYSSFVQKTTPRNLYWDLGHAVWLYVRQVWSKDQWIPPFAAALVNLTLAQHAEHHSQCRPSPLGLLGNESTTRHAISSVSNNVATEGSSSTSTAMTVPKPSCIQQVPSRSVSSRGHWDTVQRITLCSDQVRNVIETAWATFRDSPDVRQGRVSAPTDKWVVDRVLRAAATWLGKQRGGQPCQSGGQAIKTVSFVPQDMIDLHAAMSTASNGYWRECKVSGTQKPTKWYSMVASIQTLAIVIFNTAMERQPYMGPEERGVLRDGR